MSPTHTVALGQYLSVIPRKYGVRVDELAPWHDMTNPAAIAPSMA